ncbi:GNAT family N-acetyltransferase [Moritella sp. Urea-trap-13]|uniref:GNAT family N-acetyltransferase n=1 Tax=Moritella sp. Urea-trap-13 TaxID=2058327 RepID=UPI000C3372BC|nr:GNAT family N-acetyltransferase [Moritella sp. Urea-trap-13]PKH06898.1 GNAT family N-acetyltransferase [Moritella sp. Urea-trap-13]
MIIIRNYIESDAKVLWDIFFNTVRHINTRDYSQAQVEAWAPDSFDFEFWKTRMTSLSPFVAEMDGVIVGYTDLQDDGLIDHFFCHFEYQGQGIGRALMNHVFSIGLKKGITRYYSEVSVTARPFYEHLGFTLFKEQLVEVRGQKLINFVMEKLI